ncbi:MAG: hypothetical protein QOH61_369 [Chloroflexota bacterium]|jgi:hypothetical protein|nr:hypothetical protein [Chloroflexota bacterium]
MNPETRASQLGVWLGLFVAALLLVQTGTPPPAVVLCLILVAGVLLASLRWQLGLLAVAVLVVVGVILRLDTIGHAFSDVLTVTRAAIDLTLAGGSPYGHGFAESTPPGAPYAYGPLALLWYLPSRAEPYKLELLVSLALLAVFAVRGRILGLAVYAALPPLIVTAADGSNDTSAGLLLMVALLVGLRAPRAGAVGLAIAAAFKPYALAWLVPLAAYGGIAVLLPFLVASIGLWGPALVLYGPSNVLRSFQRADAIHEVPYYSLAYALADRRSIPEQVFSALRFALGATLAVVTVPMIRSGRALILAGVAIFLGTLYLGWWSTFAYVAAIAPVLCWHLDDWLGLPRVVWPGDPVGALSRWVDERWPLLRQSRGDAETARTMPA